MYPAVLNKKNQYIFSKLKQFNNFYLAGGTALALQIGHRRSIDFDLFSPKEIPPGLLKKTQAVFSNMKVLPSVNNTGELTVTIDNIKVTFLFYPFPLILKPKNYKEVKLLSVKEIAATKAYTIGRRGSLKDYVDLYFILSEKKSSLDQIIQLAKRKYKSQFNGRLFLEQLLYMDDIEDEPILFLRNPVKRTTIQEFFEKTIKKFRL